MIDPRIFEEPEPPISEWVGSVVVIAVLGIVFCLGIGVGRMMV